MNVAWATVLSPEDEWRRSVDAKWQVRLTVAHCKASAKSDCGPGVSDGSSSNMPVDTVRTGELNRVSCETCGRALVSARQRSPFVGTSGSALIVVGLPQNRLCPQCARQSELYPEAVRLRRS